MRAAPPAGGCRASLAIVAYPSLAENDVHASAMSALVNRTMSPSLPRCSRMEFDSPRRPEPALPRNEVRRLPQLGAPSITGKTYVNLNGGLGPPTIHRCAPRSQWLGVFPARRLTWSGWRSDRRA